MQPCFNLVLHRAGEAQPVGKRKNTGREGRTICRFPSPLAAWEIHSATSEGKREKALCRRGPALIETAERLWAAHKSDAAPRERPI